MPKIIIEDIKVNKKKVNPLIKDEHRSSHYTNLSNKNYIKNEKKEAEVIDKSINKIERFSNNEIDQLLNSKRSKEKIMRQTPNPYRYRNKSKNFRTILIIFFICVLLGGIFLISNFFQKANVVLTQKHQDIDYKNKQFTAFKEQVDTDNNPIKFEMVIVTDKQTKNLILTDTKEISEKAKGTITLYNEFGMNSQIISAGTFIADQEGKTYKIDKTISIPGYKLDENNNKVAGKVDANITSFLTGDIYNGSPEKLYITMFKNTNKYEKIYGKIKTPLTGGAQGLFYVLNDENKDSIKKIVENSMKNDLLNQARAQIPNGYILYPDASNFSYQIDETSYSKDPQASIGVNGSLSVVLLDKQSLIDKILKISLPNISGEEEKKEIVLNYLNDLKFSFVDPNQTITKEMNSFSFFLDGIIDATWNPDINKLKQNLAGQSKSNTSSIFKKDPGISSAVVKIFPIWQKVIPTKISNINITVK